MYRLSQENVHNERHCRKSCSRHKSYEIQFIFMHNLYLNHSLPNFTGNFKMNFTTTLQQVFANSFHSRKLSLSPLFSNQQTQWLSPAAESGVSGIWIFYDFRDRLPEIGMWQRKKVNVSLKFFWQQYTMTCEESFSQQPLFRYSHSLTVPSENSVFCRHACVLLYASALLKLAFSYREQGKCW